MNFPFGLTDDLEAGLPALPQDAAWTPDTPDESTPTLGLTPVTALQFTDHLLASILEQHRSPDLNKEQLAEIEGKLAAAYRVKSKIIALQVQDDMVTNYRKLPNDLKMDLLKLTSAHGGMVPKDDKANVSPFSLNIILDGSKAPVVVVEASPPTQLDG